MLCEDLVLQTLELKLFDALRFEQAVPRLKVSTIVRYESLTSSVYTLSTLIRQSIVFNALVGLYA
jgi:hypothetical protein